MYFRVAFGVSGDRATVPYTAVDGAVNFTDGYGTDYSLPRTTDPDARNIERNKFNQLMYDITSELQKYQQLGVPDFITTSDNGGTPFQYSKSAMVRYGSDIYLSKDNANTVLPDNTAGWWKLSGNIAYLDQANTFTANQTVTGVMTATSFTGAGTGLTGTAASLTVGAVSAGAVTNAMLANMAANTVKLATAAGSPTDFAVTANTFIGRGSTGNISLLTLGTGLVFTGTQLDVTAAAVANGSITNAKLANMAAYTLKSNATNASAAAADNTITTFLDAAVGSTPGTFLGRNGSIWTAIAGVGSGRYLRSIYITSSTTYNKSSDCNSQLVEQWSGGGGAVGSQTAGGNTVFDVMTCTGGGVSSATSGGAGGVASGGDFNLNGAGGFNVDASNFGGGGGDAPRGGRGGRNLVVGSIRAGGFPGGGASSSSASTAGAGSGAYSNKWYATAITGVSVTIGARGNGTNVGGAGLVIVHEFS